MENEHVLHGLMRKRAELAGRFEHTQRVLTRLTNELKNIDASILIFDPDAKLELIKPKRVTSTTPAFKGEVTRAVLDALREANRPMSTMELAQYLMIDLIVTQGDKTVGELQGVSVLLPNDKRIVTVPLDSAAAGALKIAYRAHEEDGGKILASTEIGG